MPEQETMSTVAPATLLQKSKKHLDYEMPIHKKLGPQRSYVINVEIRDKTNVGFNNVHDLHLTATTSDLDALLRTINDCPDIVGFSVADTVSLPQLHTFRRLTKADLGYMPNELEKLR